ncbi:hemolysin D [Bergeyella porcorum]|uniref:Hemolysin D n=2 Tax=Bergeyella porcorum TaxID=1735111 RepID=A0AAU0EYG7_9FLAO
MIMKSIIAILTLGLLFSCSNKENTTTEEVYTKTENEITLTALQKKNAGVVVENVHQQDISNKIILSGQIDTPPSDVASVSSLSGGMVQTMRFLPGDYVSKGQTLAVIENPDLARLQQEYLQAKSNLAYAQKDYERQKYLNQYQAASDKVTQRAANEAQSQSASVQGIASQLRAYGINPNSVRTENITQTVRVVAPISGYISKVNASIGQYVTTAYVLYEIVNNKHIYLMLKAFEKDLTQLSVGQSVWAYTNQNPTKKYAATIKSIGKDMAMDRSVLVQCQLADASQELIVGTFMNADVEIASKKGTVVPDDAIVSWEGKQYIFEETQPNTYKMLLITIGNSENGFTELLNFEPYTNNPIVTKGAYQLLMALKNVEE